MVRLDILAEVCTITRTIFKAYVRMNDVQRTVLSALITGILALKKRVISFFSEYYNTIFFLGRSRGRSIF